MPPLLPLHPRLDTLAAPVEEKIGWFSSLSSAGLSAAYAPSSIPRASILRLPGAASEEARLGKAGELTQLRGNLLEVRW